MRPRAASCSTAAAAATAPARSRCSCSRSPGSSPGPSPRTMRSAPSGCAPSTPRTARRIRRRPSNATCASAVRPLARSRSRRSRPSTPRPCSAAAAPATPTSPPFARGLCPSVARAAPPSRPRAARAGALRGAPAARPPPSAAAPRPAATRAAVAPRRRSPSDVRGTAARRRTPPGISRSRPTRHRHPGGASSRGPGAGAAPRRRGRGGSGAGAKARARRASRRPCRRGVGSASRRGWRPFPPRSPSAARRRCEAGSGSRWCGSRSAVPPSARREARRRACRVCDRRPAPRTGRRSRTTPRTRVQGRPPSRRRIRSRTGGSRARRSRAPSTRHRAARRRSATPARPARPRGRRPPVWRSLCDPHTPRDELLPVSAHTAVLVRLDRFVEEREPQWLELEEKMRQARGRPERLGPDGVRRLARLYRAAAADLAAARRRFPGDPAVTRLESLVTRARPVVYSAEPRRAPLLEFFSTGYWRRVRERPLLLAAACLLMLAPGVLALLWASSDPGSAAGLVPEQFRHAGDAGGRALESGGDQAAFSSGIFTNNIRVSFLAFAAGILGGLGTAAVLVYNGVLVGTVLGLASGAGNGNRLVELVAPHGFLELSCIAVAAAAGFGLGWAGIDPRSRARAGARGGGGGGGGGGRRGPG